MAITLADGPERTIRPRGLLLEAITTFDAGVSTQGTERANAERWLDGVNFQADPFWGPVIQPLDPCAVPADKPDPELECYAWITQRPFLIVDALFTSTLNLSLADLDDLLDERKPILKSYCFAKALIGPVVTTTPSSTKTLSSEAHTPDNIAFGDAAVAITYAIALLESELADNLFGAQGMIHIPPGMMHQAKTRGLFTFENGHWETPNGHIVVADAGYRNPPHPVAGGAASVATEEWIYASGPVQYQYWDGARLGDGEGQVLDRVHNKIHRIDESAGILIFEPATVSAVLAKYETA